MGTKTHNNYEDLITFTRASAGHALRPVSYGTELVSNGDFSSTDLTGWTAYDGTIAVVSGELELTYSAATQYVTHSVTTEVGKVYVFSVDARSSNAVDFRLQVENSTFGGGTVEQGYEAAFTSTASARQLVFVAEATTSVIEIFSRLTSGTAFFDNISVKEVTFDESDGTLTLFEHPEGVPRVEWDSAGNRLGLLVEEARTNVFTYSEDFSNSAWTKFPAATVTPSLVTTPDGQQNGFLLEATGTNRLEETPSTTITGTATFSIFAKYDDVPYVQMTILDSSANGQRQWFKIQDGTLGSSAAVGTGKNLDGASITDMNNGFYRLSLSVDGFSSQTARCLIYLARTDSSFDAASGDSAVVYGAQLEQSSFPTSYIKTTGSTASRSVDVAELDKENFGFNLNAGTIFYEGQDIANNYSGAINSGGGFHVWFGGDGSNYVGGLYHSPSSGLTSSVYYRGSATTEIVNSGRAMSDNGKTAIAYDLGNSISVSVDGGTVATQTATAPTAYNNFDWKIRLGGGTSGSTTNTSVYVKQLKFYPRRLTNAQLQALTEPRSTPTLSLTFDGQESSYKENYIHG